MPSTNYAYVNGRFVHEAEATVSIFDRGFLYGDGCFETMRVYGGKLFRVNQHLGRLFGSLDKLGIGAVLSPEELRAACLTLIRQNNLDDGIARLYQTRDSIVITAQPHRFEVRELRAIVSSLRVDRRLSRHKTANRLVYILAQREAQCAEVNEAVLLNEAGSAVEFTTSNLFVVQNGELFTPPLDDGPLPGITRRAVVALAEEQRIPVHQRSFGPDFLDIADEVLATNSLIEIVPVATWSRRQDITTRLQQAYRELVARELSMPGP